MRFSATLVWAHSNGFCLFVVAIFLVVYICGKLKQPSWKEENHSHPAAHSFLFVPLCVLL